MKRLLLTVLAVADFVACAFAVPDITLTGTSVTNFTGDVTFGKLLFSGGGQAYFNDANVLAGWVNYETSGTVQLEFHNTTADFGSAIGTWGATAWYVGCGPGTEKMNTVIDHSDLTLQKGLVAGNTGTGSYCNFYVTNSTVSLTLAGAVFNTTGRAYFEFVDSTLSTAFTAASNSGLKLGQIGGDSGGTVPGSASFKNSSVTNAANTWVAMTSPFSLALTGADTRFKTYKMMIGGWDYSVTLGGLRNGDVTVTDGAVLEAQELNVGTQGGGVGVLAVTNATLAVKTLKSGYGTSTLLLDNATIRMTADKGSLFAGLGTLEIGESGLTVDTAGFAVTNARSFSGGPVLFTGGGKVTIASGVTIANYDAAPGTALVWTDPGTVETISQTSGSSTRTDDVLLDGNDTLVVDVAVGAALALEGKVRAGVLDKQGGGLLALGHDGDRFFDSVKLTGGTLDIAADGPSTLPTLAITNAAAGSAPVVVKADRAVRAGLVHHSENFVNPLIKRGTGELALVFRNGDGWAPYAIPKGTLTGTTTTPSYELENPIDFGDGTAVPTKNYGSVNVAEGALTLDVTAMGAFQSGPVWVVGNPLVSCAATPELTVRGNRANNSRAWGVGSVDIAPAAKAGVSPIAEARFNLYDMDFRSTYITGATLSDDPDLRVYVNVTNSKVQCAYYQPCGIINQLYENRPFAYHRFSAGSKLYCSVRIDLRGPFYMEFDDSELSKGNLNNDGVLISHSTIDFHYYGGVTTNTVAFVNGGVFCSVGKGDPQVAEWTVPARQTFIFDNGVIDPMTNGVEFTYNFDDRINAYFEMRGRGLVMKPALNQTFTMAEALHGEGGFVNRGAGTVVLAEGVVQYAGVTRAESGTVSFADAAVTNVTLAGAGSFTHGTLVRAKVLADGTAPQLDGVTLDGKVTVVFGDTVPAIGTTVDVARTSGSIANWWTEGGADYSVTLSKEGNMVQATVGHLRGLQIIIR